MGETPIKEGIPSSRQHAAARPAAANGIRTKIDSAELFRGGQELLINHDGQQYLLRTTRQGKLILTKY